MAGAARGEAVAGQGKAFAVWLVAVAALWWSDKPRSLTNLCHLSGPHFSHFTLPLNINFYPIILANPGEIINREVHPEDIYVGAKVELHILGSL